MQVNPYLFYDGNCEAALKFYEKVLGAKIEAMLRYESGPKEMPVPPQWEKKLMHAKVTIDGEVIMAADAPPGNFLKPQGFRVSLQVDDPADAGRRFKALAEGGKIDMAFGETFFSRGFGMCTDQFGTPWMLICPLEE
jgi:PhnB protein